MKQREGRSKTERMKKYDREGRNETERCEGTNETVKEEMRQNGGMWLREKWEREKSDRWENLSVLREMRETGDKWDREGQYDCRGLRQSGDKLDQKKTMYFM